MNASSKLCLNIMLPLCNMIIWLIVCEKHSCKEIFSYAIRDNHLLSKSLAGNPCIFFCFHLSWMWASNIVHEIRNKTSWATVNYSTEYTTQPLTIENGDRAKKTYGQITKLFSSEISKTLLDLASRIPIHRYVDHFSIPPPASEERREKKQTNFPIYRMNFVRYPSVFD